MKFGVGQSPPRLGDPRLVASRGRFTGDLSFPGEAWIACHRSPWAHGRIVALDVRAAHWAPAFAPFTPLPTCVRSPARRASRKGGLKI